VVPDEVIDRPKGYFPVPALKYLRGPFLDYVRDILNDPAHASASCSIPLMWTACSPPEGALTPKGHSKLWQVAVIEQWLQAHGI